MRKPISIHTEKNKVFLDIDNKTKSHYFVPF